jgi:hypothetical protein
MDHLGAIPLLPELSRLVEDLVIRFQTQPTDMVQVEEVVVVFLTAVMVLLVKVSMAVVTVEETGPVVAVEEQGQTDKIQLGLVGVQSVVMVARAPHQA